MNRRALMIGSAASAVAAAIPEIAVANPFSQPEVLRGLIGNLVDKFNREQRITYVDPHNFEKRYKHFPEGQLWCRLVSFTQTWERSPYRTMKEDRIMMLRMHAYLFDSTVKMSVSELPPLAIIKATFNWRGQTMVGTVPGGHPIAFTRKCCFRNYDVYFDGSLQSLEEVWL